MDDPIDVKDSPPDAGMRDWRKKTFIFLASQSMSLFGTALVNFAIIWYITLTTGSGIMLTFSLLASFLPQIMISLFAGVWADRLNRKYVIMASDGLTAAATLGLALFFMAGYREIWLLFAATAIRSVGAGIQSPAISAIMPQFVPPGQLVRVNGIAGSVRSFILILSPAAGGWLLAAFSVETAFLVDVVTAAAAIAIMGLLRIPPHEKAAAAQDASALEDLKQGIIYIKGHPLLRRLLVYYAFFFFLVSPAAFLTPLMVTRSFGAEVWRLTANEVLYSSGAITGGLIMAAWGGFRHRMLTIAMACGAHGLFVILLGLAPGFIAYLAAMFFLGVFMPIFSTAETVMIQETVDNNMQGRVFSMIDVIILAVMPAGMLLFGPLADRMKVEYLLIATGLMMTAVSGLILSENRHHLRSSA